MAALTGAAGGMPAMTTAAPADAATMQQVRTVEQLATAVSSSTATKEQRASAQAQLAAMGKQTAHIPLIRAVMDHSNEPAALQAAANALTQLVTDFWTSYTVPQRVELRKFAELRQASDGGSGAPSCHGVHVQLTLMSYRMSCTCPSLPLAQGTTCCLFWPTRGQTWLCT